MPLRILGTIGCLLVIISTGARAQARPVAHLGDRVRLVVNGGDGAMIGKLVAVSRDSVWYQEPCRECVRRSLARASIDTVTVRMKTSNQPVRIGVGAVVGVVAAAISWMALVERDSEGCRDGPCGIAIIYTPIAAVLGGIAGGVLGWLTSIESWVPADLADA